MIIFAINSLIQVIMQRLNKDPNALRGTHHPGKHKIQTTIYHEVKNLIAKGNS